MTDNAMMTTTPTTIDMLTYERLMLTYERYTLTTRHGDSFMIPALTKGQARTISPSRLLKTLLDENPKVPWAHFTRSNFAEIVFHLATIRGLLLEPRPSILPPFPRVNEAASRQIASDWASVTSSLDLPLPATPSSFAFSSSRHECYTFEYNRHIYQLRWVTSRIFHNLNTMPDLAAFLKEVIHVHNADVPAGRDEGFIRTELLRRGIDRHSKAAQAQIDISLIVDSMMDDKAIKAYLDSQPNKDSERRPCYQVIYSANNGSAVKVVRQGPSANSHHPLFMLGAGCITSTSPGRPYSATKKYGKISDAHWDILTSENRTLTMKVRDGLSEYDDWKIMENVLNAGKSGLHYAFTYRAEEICLVYTSTWHRDHAREQLRQSAEAMKHIVDKHVKELSGPWVRSYMTWEIPRKLVGKAEELQEVLNNHFKGTGYSSRYTHSEIETLEETIAITFHNVPPWLGHKITTSGPPGQIAVRPSLYSAQPYDGPLNERGLGYLFLGEGGNRNSSSAIKANVAKPGNGSRPGPVLVCDPIRNPVYAKMIETSAARLGGINEPLELAGDLSLPYLDFRTFLGVLKCVMNPSAKRIEELFLKYMQFIEDGFPTSSRDDKLEAFMRAGGDLPVKMESEYALRVAAMREWREWIKMPVEPTIIEILIESQPEKLAGHLPSTAKPSVQSKAVGRKRKRFEDVKS